MEKNKTDVRSIDRSVYEESNDSSQGMIGKTKTLFKKLAGTRKFNSDSVPTAYQSYLKSTYGTVENNDARLDNFMAKVSETILYKNGRQEYSLVMGIPDDICDYTDLIVDFFRRKGYVTRELSQIVPELCHRYLFIAFDNFRVAQDNLEKFQPKES